MRSNFKKALAVTAVALTVCSAMAFASCGHEHEAGTEWQTDATSHWHLCTADDGEVMDKAEHTYDEGKVTTEATYVSEGEKTYTCTVCGVTKTETIEAKTLTGTVDMSVTSATTVEGLGDVDVITAMTVDFTAMTADLTITYSAYGGYYSFVLIANDSATDGYGMNIGLGNVVKTAADTYTATWGEGESAMVLTIKVDAEGVCTCDVNIEGVVTGVTMTSAK